MKSYEVEMNKVLHALHDADALKSVIVTGSWAMFFYKLIFKNFIPRVETTDLDLYLPNPKHASGNNISSKLYSYSYKRYDDCMTGKTLFLSEEGFSIEFQTIPDRNMTSTIDVKGLNIVAEALPKIAPAGWNYIQVEYDKLNVNVISPVSFVLQKLLINKERIPEYKKEKDIEAVKYVLNFVKTSPKYYQELQKSLNTYPKKWKKAIFETASLNKIEF